MVDRIIVLERGSRGNWAKIAVMYSYDMAHELVQTLTDKNAGFQYAIEITEEEVTF